MFMFLYKIEVVVTLYPIGLILGGSQQFILLKLNLAVHSLLSPFHLSIMWVHWSSNDPYYRKLFLPSVMQTAWKKQI